MSKVTENLIRRRLWKQNAAYGEGCYTTSKGNSIYKPHSAVGMVGRSAAGYLAQRKRM